MMIASDDPLSQLLGTVFKVGGDGTLLVGDEVVGAFLGDLVRRVGETVRHLAANLEKFPFLGSLLKLILTSVGQLVEQAGGDEF